MLRNLSPCNNSGVSLYGHRSRRLSGAGQLGLCKNGVFKRLFDRRFDFMAKKHAGCAKCACATSEMQVQPTPATAPQMVPQRYRGRRTCRTARSRRCSCRFQLQSTKMLQTAPFYLRTCLQGFLRNHNGDRPSPGQGSYQRWRERGVHRSRTDTSSSWTSMYDVTTPNPQAKCSPLGRARRM
jgi:hypothetical protein